MAIEYKDINQLTQKSSVAGTEKIEVSDTEYITPSQIASLVGSSFVPYSTERVTDANLWTTIGYALTNGTLPTANLPSICTGSDRWGVLFWIAENATRVTGTQMYYPIDGTYKGRIFYRSAANNVWTSWELIPLGSEKQDTLVSGTNIKTVNNQSLLGSGNITIQGSSNVSVYTFQADGWSGAFYGEGFTINNATYQSFLDDVSNGKSIIIRTVYQDYAYDWPLLEYDEGTFVFDRAGYSSGSDPSFRQIFVMPPATQGGNAGVSAGARTPELTTNRANSITGAGSPTEYPSSRAVVNYVTPRVLPEVTSSDQGKLLYANYSSGVGSWVKSAYYFASEGLYSDWNSGFVAQGTLGSTNIFSGGLFKTGNWNDWSWIQRLDTSSGQYVNLQDYLDSMAIGGLPAVTSADYGRMLFVDYDSTRGYFWSKNSPMWFTSEYLRLGAYYGIEIYDTSGSDMTISPWQLVHNIGGNYQRDWRWLCYQYYDQAAGTTIQVTLKDTLDTKVSTTGNESVGGNKTFTDNVGVVDADHIVYSGGGGGGGFTRGYKTEAAGGVNIIVFTGLAGEPKAFIVSFTELSGSSSETGMIAVVGDATGCHGVYSADSSHQHNYTNAITTSYSNGTFTITAPSGVLFPDALYSIVYYYGEGTLTFKTSQIQPGSGVTAVTFTGTDLTEVPAMYALMLETQVNNESYRRVAYYTNESGGASATPMGVSFFSSQIHNTTSSFTATYNNGLNINSGGTNAGGYFHNPGTYVLYYLMADDIGSGGGGGGFQSLGDELDDIRDTIGDIATILASI